MDKILEFRTLYHYNGGTYTQRPTGNTKYTGYSESSVSEQMNNYLSKNKVTVKSVQIINKDYGILVVTELENKEVIEDDKT